MPVNNFVVFCSVCKDTLDCSSQLITKACHEMGCVSCYGVACNVIFLMQSEMDNFQFTAQFNLHDLIIGVYITIYYFGSNLSLEWLPTLASCWHWLKWIDVTSQGLFEVTVFKVEFCLGHCWRFSVCPHHSSETMSCIYWCMCPTNSSYLTIWVLNSYRISLFVRTPVYNQIQWTEQHIGGVRF
jgi:hypothetical protein